MAPGYSTVAVGQLAERAYDIVTIGTDMGRGTLAYGLWDSSAPILLVECGDFIPSEPENWDPDPRPRTESIVGRGEA